MLLQISFALVGFNSIGPLCLDLKLIVENYFAIIEDIYMCGDIVVDFAKHYLIFKIALNLNVGILDQGFLSIQSDLC